MRVLAVKALHRSTEAFGDGKAVRTKTLEGAHSSVCRPVEGDTFVLIVWETGSSERESATTIRQTVYTRPLVVFKRRRLSWQGLVLDKAETTSGP
jgi:hypothetical protein